MILGASVPLDILVVLLPWLILGVIRMLED